MQTQVFFLFYDDDCNIRVSHRLIYSMLDAVPPILAESSHVATDKDSSIRHLGGKFRRSIFSDNLQPIATRGKKGRGTLLVDIGCSSKRASPPLVITTKLLVVAVVSS